jgi:hypothetical protein
MLFAEAPPAGIFILLAIGIAGYIIYALYCYDMAKNRPEEWAAWCERAQQERMHAREIRAQQQLARERQRLEEERLRQEAARRSRNGLMLGLGGALLRVFLNHHYRH